MTTINNSQLLRKFYKLKERFVEKVRMSQTPVKGFVLGLSGTDSIVTAMLLNELSESCPVPLQIHAFHYVENVEKLSSFQKNRMDKWFSNNCPSVVVQVKELASGNFDQFRWADQHYFAIEHGLWVVSTMNATEKELGTYSIMNKSASIAPIQSLYKTEVLELCKLNSVPDEQIQLSSLPDCACGRDEFAAEHIKEIDDLLRNEISTATSIETWQKVAEYVKETKRLNSFKTRTPYSI
ncbi:NAD+synthetase [Xanthomonas phage Xoo-sp13]|nr:NAD+synthetase [Xanthomonas phage Xoo-sp13]